MYASASPHASWVEDWEHYVSQKKGAELFGANLKLRRAYSNVFRAPGNRRQAMMVAWCGQEGGAPRQGSKHDESASHEVPTRSEERRVGKECRYRRTGCQ